MEKEPESLQRLDLNTQGYSLKCFLLKECQDLNILTNICWVFVFLDQVKVLMLLFGFFKSRSNLNLIGSVLCSPLCYQVIVIYVRSSICLRWAEMVERQGSRPGT